jgi:hypothetical protein
MTEMTYIPKPEEIIAKLESVCLENLERGDTHEREKARLVVGWSLALVHCFDLQRLPEKHRKAALDTEKIVGQEGAALMVRLSDPSVDSNWICDAYLNFTEDIAYLCGEVSTRVSVAYTKAIKCQT